MLKKIEEKTRLEGTLKIQKYFPDGSKELLFEEKNLIVLAARQNILQGFYSTPLTISSITGNVNNIVTVTTSSNHGLSTEDIVVINGVSPIEYNGTFSIVVLTPNQFSYYALYNLSNGTGSGTTKLVYPTVTPDPINTLEIGIGGAMDSRTIGLCSISISTSTITTTASPGFLPTDVGQPITIQGAGPGGSVLNVTVASYISATQITISEPAYTTVNNISVTIGQGLFPSQEDPLQTSLNASVASLATTYIVNNTTPSVTFIADADQSTANGFLLTEAGLVRLSGALFNIKNYPGIPKTSDFGVHYVWTIKYA